MCSDCETCGLLNHCTLKMIEDVTRKCVRIVRHVRFKQARINEVWLYVTRPPSCDKTDISSLYYYYIIAAVLSERIESPLLSNVLLTWAGVNKYCGWPLVSFLRSMVWSLTLRGGRAESWSPIVNHQNHSSKLTIRSSACQDVLTPTALHAWILGPGRRGISGNWSYICLILVSSEMLYFNISTCYNVVEHHQIVVKQNQIYQLSNLDQNPQNLTSLAVRTSLVNDRMSVRMRLTTICQILESSKMLYFKLLHLVQTQPNLPLPNLEQKPQTVKACQLAWLMMSGEPMSQVCG